MATSNRLMDFLWIIIAFTDESKLLLPGALINMGFYRIIFFFLGKKLFAKRNFYAKYIIGMAAAFIVILIATKGHGTGLFFAMMTLNEIFGFFRRVGDDAVLKEIIKKDKISATFSIMKWMAIPLAGLILAYYTNMIEYIYAPLAVITGLAMIILYNGFSKDYAKMKVEEAEEKVANHKSWKDHVAEVISGLILIAMYALLVFNTENGILIIAWISVIGIILEITTRKNTKSNSALYEGIGLIVLAIVRFVV